MKTFLKILAWIFFISILAVTIILGLDTFGIRPWAPVQKNKVSDLSRELDFYFKQRTFLISQKALLEGRIKAFKGDTKQQEAANNALNEAIESFAKKDYDGAEANMKLAKLALSSKWSSYIKDKERNRAKLLNETKSASTIKKPVIPTATEDAIQKKITSLEEKLASVTDPSIDTNEAWMYLDRTLNALRAGDIKEANYFLTESEIAIDDVTE